MFDRRAKAQARVPRSVAAVLPQALAPTVEGLQEATGQAMRRARDQAAAVPLANAKTLTVQVQSGRVTVPHGLARPVVSLTQISGVTVSLVSSDSATMTLAANSSGSATVAVQ